MQVVQGLAETAGVHQGAGAFYRSGRGRLSFGLGAGVRLAKDDDEDEEGGNGVFYG